MIEIKQIKKESIPTLFDHISNALSSTDIASLGFSPTVEHLNKQTILDPDFDPKLLLGAFTKEGQLVGSTMGLSRSWKNDTAHIKWILINRDFRNKGIGNLLLNAVEAKLKKQNPKEIVFGSSSPLYFLPGVPKNSPALVDLLNKKGWKKSSLRVSLFANISSENINDELFRPANNSSDFLFEIVNKNNSQKTLDFITDEFNSSWATEAKMALNTTNKIGAVAIAKTAKTNEVVGFAALNGSNPNWFGPMGIKKSLRKSGLGRALVYEVIKISQKQNMNSIILPWINGKEKFYPRFFKKYSWLEYHSFSKVF